MQVANTLLNQLAYGSNSVQNKSQSATDFAVALENNLPPTSASIELRSGALVSGGIFTDGGRAMSASVYYSENHSPDNPVYTVRGKNIDGTPFEIDVNINNVDPRNASFIEMQALYAHLETTGQASDRIIMNPFLSVFAGSYTNPDAFTKADFLAPMMQMMEWQEANKNWDGYNHYKKLIDVLMDYIQKHKEQTELALQNIDSDIDLLDLLKVSQILWPQSADKFESLAFMFE